MVKCSEKNKKILIVTKIGGRHHFARKALIAFQLIADRESKASPVSLML